MNPMAVTGKLCLFWPIKTSKELRLIVFINPSLEAIAINCSFLEGFILVTALLWISKVDIGLNKTPSWVA
jgi:hypothetical protein